MSYLKQLALSIPHSGPSYNPEPLPRRGDSFETWLKSARDHIKEYCTPSEASEFAYDILDGLLDEYRLHADTGTPLNEHVCEGGHHEQDCE